MIVCMFIFFYSVMPFPRRNTFSESRFSGAQGMPDVTRASAENIDGLVQDYSNSISNALELLQSCTKPSICCLYLIATSCYLICCLFKKSAYIINCFK